VFTLGIIFVIIAVIAAIIAIITRRGGAIATAVVAALLFALSWTIASYNRVPTNNVGIVTVYGRPTGETTGAGLKWRAPWQDIQDWDATRQPYNYLNAKCEQPGDGSLWVSIDGQREACIRVQVNWRSKRGATASKNWANYKGAPDERFGQFTDRQVNPLIADSVQTIFRTLNPLALVNPATGDATVPNLDVDYTPQLRAEVAKRLGGDIEVDSIAWGVIGYDAPTRASISAYAQKTYDTRNLSVDKANAQSRAEIAGKSGVPAAEQACLDMIKALGKGEPGLCVTGPVITRPVA
jgi:hypothetical protein